MGSNERHAEEGQQRPTGLTGGWKTRPRNGRDTGVSGGKEAVTPASTGLSRKGIPGSGLLRTRV